MNGHNRKWSSKAWGLAFVMLLALSACQGPGNAPGEPTASLSLITPTEGQTVAGTIALAASAGAGEATGLVFRLGGLEVTAGPDGTATLDTRSLSDGPAVLEAAATVGNKSVTRTLNVTIRNDLPSSGTVSTQGGALKSTGGSLAMVPPGALDDSVALTVEDLTQQEILDRFGVDYEGLGITFLGALEVTSGGAPATDIPYQVDLAGWSEGVQPGQQVLMFQLAPDADGDGVGELMLAADAQATPDGSVITRPVPKAEALGFSSIGGAALSPLAVPTVRPGQLVTLQARGFTPGSAYGNVAIFEPGGLEVLARPTLVGSESFNPLMELEVAIPRLSKGAASVRFVNLSTGFRSEPLDLTAASSSGDSWAGLAAQLDAAVAGITQGRPALAAQAGAWLSTLRATDSDVAAAMAAQSGLVSASNQSLLDAIAAGSYTAAQRDLVVRHALLLDAIAVSVPELQSAAANLAGLLPVASPLAAIADAAGRLTTLQAGGGNPCSSPGARVFGSTGMGAAPPPGGGACGGAGGGGGAGGSNLRAQQVSGFGPVAGAIVQILRQGTSEKLSPFTSLTDEAGYYYIPFVPEGEPFTVRAVDPRTGYTASADGVGPATGQSVAVPLVFTPGEIGPGSPTAAFTITPLPGGSLEGSWRYELDASASSDPDGEIAEYIWDFGGFVTSVDWTPAVIRGYGRNGSYQIRLTVIDNEGKAATTTRELVIDDLPYDYWAMPPERVSEAADGTSPNVEVDYGFNISADGRYITFTTEAGNLHPDDVNGLSDVYLKDMETGALELVSSGAAGLEAWNDVAMSSDARYIAYTEEEAPPHGTGPNRILVKDRQEGTFEAVVNPAGLRSNSVDALSDDGRVLAFSASSLNNSERPTYVIDLDTDEITRLGWTFDRSGYVNVRVVDLSLDGRYVVFESTAGTLVEGDTNGRNDVFVTDLDLGTTVRASVASDGAEGDGSSSAWGSVLTPDGRFVTFYSDATNFLNGGDNDDEFDNQDDVYVKDLSTGELELVNSNAFGELADSASILPVISADGRYVAFGSYATNLAPEMDAYNGDCALSMCNQGFSFVKDRQTGRVVLVSVGLNDTLPDDWDQIEPIISADGRYIGFYSWATNLAPNATNGDMNYYRIENPLWTP